MADVMNQLLLRAGLHLSRRAPTRQHPYGFHKEKYIYALMSAVGIFCLGAGAAVGHGVQSLFDPPHLENMVWSLGGASEGRGESGRGQRELVLRGLVRGALHDFSGCKLLHASLQSNQSWRLRVSRRCTRSRSRLATSGRRRASRA